MGLIIGFLGFLLLSVLSVLSSGNQNVYNVLDFGAVGDGKGDDTQSFLKAWAATCMDMSPSTFLVPANKTFLLNQIIFAGSCKSSIQVQVDGNVVAPSYVWKVFNDRQTWIAFMRIDNLTIYGNGQFDGQGSPWWKCKEDNKCSVLPDGFSIFHCDNFRMQGLKFMNAPRKQVSVYGSTGVYISNLNITSPGDSPNTDGMHIQECQDVTVENSNIASGDDCIAVGTGTTNVKITQINCGPGHGISIGSLGNNAQVSNIHVSHCNFYQTMNGARIKTWSGGSGLAQGISFEQLTMNDVKFPIILDQYYCPEKNCKNYTSSVEVKDIRFVGINGTTSQELGIILSCSTGMGCTGILLEDVNITSSVAGQMVNSFCQNAHGNEEDPVHPKVPCLGRSTLTNADGGMWMDRFALKD